MSLDLSSQPLLQAAQDSLSRDPIVEILSQNSVDDIPFDGQYLTPETTNETNPNMIIHGTGRLCLIYAFGTVEFKYVYTDIGRQEYFFISIIPPGGAIPISATLCELADGNIGVVYHDTYGGKDELRRLIISPIGGVEEPDALIEQFASIDILDSPFVYRLSNDEYLLVYRKKDGSDYKIMKRTSSDFITWSAESQCDISGLTSTHNIYNISLLQTTNEDVLLWFDYVDSTSGGVEITNIYFSVLPVAEVANLATDTETWGAATKVTSYTLPQAVGKHPTNVQKVANESILSYTEVRNALYSASHYATIPAQNFTFDSVNRKLFVVENDHPTGSGFYGVRKIDIDSWEEEDYWDWNFDINRPDHAYWQNPVWGAHSFGVEIGDTRHHGEYPYISVASINSAFQMASVLDVESDIIYEYYFRDYSWGGYTLTKNITGLTVAAAQYLYATWVDEATNRLYCVIGGTPGYSRFIIGYFEIGSYEWHEVVPEQEWPILGTGSRYFHWKIDVATDRIFMSSAWGNPGNGPGRVRIYQLSTGGLIKDYNMVDYPDFPHHGFKFFTIVGDKFYGVGEAYYGYTDNYYLTEINLVTDIITRFPPSWDATPPHNYHWGDVIKISDNEICVMCEDWGSSHYGINIFNTDTHQWTQFNNTTVPGLTPTGTDHYFGALAYDPVNEIIFAGVSNGFTTCTGVIAFSRYGAFKRTYYLTGLYSGGVWTFDVGTILPLVQEWTDFDLVAAVDPDVPNLWIYAYWVKSDEGLFSIKWDKDGSQLDISDYLVKGSEVILHRTIDGAPSSLEFQVSHGHLFDPHNSNSLLSIYLKKFRKLNLRFGERCEGNDLWQNQGTFYVIENKISYERPKYPIFSVKAEDRLSMWEFSHVIATSIYDGEYPEDILESILVQNTDLEPITDIDIDNFDNRVVLYHQWIETPLKDIIAQICERFGYYPRMDVNNKFTAKKITNAGPVDHLYPDSIPTVNFTPDDSFSDWTNQVTVVGESHDMIEVMFAEEQVGQLSGAAGWWHKKKTYYIWYSQDHTRTCRHARLEILESVKDGPYFSKSGSEWISGEFSTELGFALVVDGPNLVAQFIVCLIIWLALAIICAVLGGTSSWVGIACNIAVAYAMFNVMQILGTQGTYQYNFYANPVGKVRQSYQAIADDLTLQSQIGMVIPRKIEDPLCYNEAQCQTVADFELMVAECQRNRIKDTKLAHLQDEDGDTIEISHPYTGLMMDIFITDLTRRYKVPTSHGSGDGSFIDEIEGWKL